MTEKLDQLRNSVGPLQQDVIDGLASGSLNRRSFLVRGSVVGLSAAFMGSVLAACGSDDTSAPATTAGGCGATRGANETTAGANETTAADGRTKGGGRPVKTTERQGQKTGGEREVRVTEIKKKYNQAEI